MCTQHTTCCTSRLQHIAVHTTPSTTATPEPTISIKATQVHIRLDIFHVGMSSSLACSECNNLLHSITSNTCSDNVHRLFSQNSFIQNRFMDSFQRDITKTSKAGHAKNGGGIPCPVHYHTKTRYDMASCHDYTPMTSHKIAHSLSTKQSLEWLS